MNDISGDDDTDGRRFRKDSLNEDEEFDEDETGTVITQENAHLHTNSHPKFSGKKLGFLP